MNARQQEIAALVQAGRTNAQIVKEATCSSSSVTKVRAMLAAEPKLLTGGGDVVEMVPAEGKPSKLKERIGELEQEAEYLRARNAELLDHIADLSMDATRLRTLLNKQAEG